MKRAAHYECCSDPAEMSAVRARMRASARAFSFDEDTIHELVLAVDEACTNIIRHAYGGRRNGRIEIDITASRSTWEVCLRDYGKKCDPSRFRGRDLRRVRAGGLGLFLIARAFDEVHFDLSPADGTCLILRKMRVRQEEKRARRRSGTSRARD